MINDLMIALDILKAITPFILGGLLWYAKLLLESIRAVEKDINQIKITLAEQITSHSGLIERIEANEKRHEKVHDALELISKQVAVLESKI